MPDDAHLLQVLLTDDPATARRGLASLTPGERTTLAGRLDQLRALIVPGDAPHVSSVDALRKAALFLWRYADTIETAPQTAAEHLPTSEARDDARDHADHLRKNLDQVLAALTEAGEPAVEEPLYRAKVDVTDGRWRLRVYEPHGPASHACGNCDGIDPGSCLFNTGPLALAADLGPAGNAFAPAVFGRQLTEHGYMIVPAECCAPGTREGWTSTGEPDTYRARCVILT